MKDFAHFLWSKVTGWLMKERPPPVSPLCDFNRLVTELRLADIILVEGRSRVADVIKIVTQSAWTHSAIYIGCLDNIHHPKLKSWVEKQYKGDGQTPLIVEALLGEGTIVSPIERYRKDHLRICRAAGLSKEDAQQVIRHVCRSIGNEYDIRHLLDLARFFFPWFILPRRWRSSLFQHNVGKATKTVCSCLMAEAFTRINYPILPFIDRSDDGTIRFYKRNPRLFTPSDFDYSPYFNIVKYPFLGIDDIHLYRKLPWCEQDIYYNDGRNPALKESEAIALAKEPTTTPSSGVVSSIIHLRDQAHFFRKKEGG